MSATDIIERSRANRPVGRQTSIMIDFISAANDVIDGTMLLYRNNDPAYISQRRVYFTDLPALQATTSMPLCLPAMVSYSGSHSVV